MKVAVSLGSRPHHAPHQFAFVGKIAVGHRKTSLSADKVLRSFGQDIYFKFVACDDNRWRRKGRNLDGAGQERL